MRPLFTIGKKLRRTGFLGTQKTEEPRGRAFSAEKTRGRSEPRQTDPARSTEKKVMRLSRKRGMVKDTKDRIQRLHSLWLQARIIHKSIFYCKAKGRSDELLRMRKNEVA